MRHALGVIIFFVLGSAQAALVDRGGGFIYDDVLNITWTQNADINGWDTWNNQVAWADSLSIYDSVRDVTWDDWRLASLDVDGDDTIVSCPTNTEVACRDNELGYMWFQNGVTPGTPGLFTNFSADPFSNVYWSGTEYAPNTDNAWYFDLFYDAQFNAGKEGNNKAWAVRDGDVAASVVPIPAAVWLFGSGLGLLGWVRRKRPSDLNLNQFTTPSAGFYYLVNACSWPFADPRKRFI